MGNLLIFVGLTTLFFSLLYKMLPDVEVAWRDVWMERLSPKSTPAGMVQSLGFR
jgi:hypothetical protein